MEMSETLYVTNREAWRAWLAAHHADTPEIWVIFYKKGTGEPSLPYEDAVEEAVCYGWVDSLIQRIDNARYARKFTPRRAGSNWSASNRLRLRKMQEAGKMAEAGLAVIDFDETEDPDAGRPRGEPVAPDWIRQTMVENSPAWDIFERLGPSQQRQYLGWITSAKREATQQRRLAEAIELLKKGETLAMR